MWLAVDYEDRARLYGGEMTLQRAAPDRIQVSDEASRFGRRAVRSEVQYRDFVAGGPRAETQVAGQGESRYRPGQTVYYGFSVGLPGGWVDDGANQDIVFQWKNIKDPAEAQHKSPDVFLSVKRDMFVLRITSDPRRTSTTSSPNRELEMLVKRLDFEQGGWHDFAFEIRWSYSDDGRIVGRYRDAGPLERPSAGSFRQVLEHRGPNVHNDVHPGYLKWGIYKPSWKSGPTQVDRRVVFHDHIRVGNSWGEVM